MKRKIPILNIIFNTILLIPIAIRMAYKLLIVIVLRDYKILNIAVNEVVEKEGKAMPEVYRKRFRLYAIMGAVLGEWMSLLTGKSLTQKERHIAMYFCALTPVFDDLIDDYNYSAEDIYRLCKGEARDGDLLEKICIHFYEKLKTLTQKSDNELLNEYFEKVLDYQIRSRAQINGSLSDTELTEIMYAKGGYSILYFKSIMDNGVQQNEEKTLFNIGALIQFVNDIFDVYKDLQGSIQTLPNATKDIKILENQYANLLDDTIKTCYTLPYHRLRIRCFLLSLMLIYSRGFVCLDQFFALQVKPNNVFEPNNYIRKDLICDMEKFRNLWKSYLYTVWYF